MRITRTAIINTIMAQLQDCGGSGCSYDCFLNGNHIHYNSYTNLKKQANVGDVVSIAILRGGTYWIHTERFTLTPELIVKYGNWQNPNKPVRDSQRGKIYHWQDRLNNEYDLRVKIEDNEIHNLIDEVCSWWRIKPPTWESVTTKGSEYQPWNHHIRLGVYGKNKLTVLHEVAHALTRYDVPGHCPKFMGTFVAVLARYTHVPIEKMITLANQRRIKFDYTVPMFPIK